MSDFGRTPARRLALRRSPSPAAAATTSPSAPRVAAELAALCDEARQDVEALGLPAEVGIAVVRPWANRGTRLAEDIRRLDGETPEERELLGSLATAYEEYYAGLRLGATIYAQTKSLEAYAATVERAKPFLAEADSARDAARRARVHRAPVRGTNGDGAANLAARNGVSPSRTSEEWGHGRRGVASRTRPAVPGRAKQSIIGCPLNAPMRVGRFLRS